MAKAPLEGIRVVSLDTGVVGPDLGMTLGQLGADVIKIESMEHPDIHRTIYPEVNSYPSFNESNRNKRSFGVNLTTEKGRELVRELTKLADIVEQNFRGGVVEKLGLDYESVRRINPDIIYFSGTAFGGGGPYSDFRGYGPLMAAASGLTDLWARPEDPYPAGANIALPDHAAAKQGVLAVVAALDYRRRTGKGQFIDLSLVEVGASFVGDAFLDYTINGRVPRRVGNRSPCAAPHGCYCCKGEDQWCAISVFTEDEWQRFCEAIGSPAWTKDPKFADLVGRLNNVEELDKLVEEWTIERDPREVMNILQAAGVAAGMALRAPDAIDDPQLKWLNAIVELDHPVVGKRLYPGNPFRISGMALAAEKRAPLFGEHTDEICRDLLHMSEEHISRLKEEKVLEGP